MKSQFINLALLLPQYSGASFEDLDISEPVLDDEPLVNNGEDELLKLIFAPDPVFGLPNSDLALILSKDTSPVVAQYIRDNLMQPRDSSNCGDDADFALSVIKDRNESYIEYSNRLRDLAYSNPD